MRVCGRNVVAVLGALGVLCAAGSTGCGGDRGNSTKPAARGGGGAATEAAGAGAAAAVPEDNGPIMEGDHSIIRREALGPLRIGEWRRPVMSFVYAISARAGRDSSDIIVVHGIGKDTATLTFQNDTLRRIIVTHVGPHTVTGIGIGTPFATVASASGASTELRGSARVATISNLCGVEFATDSAALLPDSATRSSARPTTNQDGTVGAIAIGYCER